MHQSPYHSGVLENDAAFDKLESAYMERIKPYTREELNIFSELLALTCIEHHSNFGDFLGEIAGESELLNARGGQFFTPYAVCQMMAKISLGNVRKSVEEKGLVTIGEPAVGAGALVIASAEEIAAQDVDPKFFAQFDCTDVSRNAFNMAYIQLCAQNLQAIVRHGNTLSNEYWEHRPTPQLRLFWKCVKQRQRSEQLTVGAIALSTEVNVLSEQHSVTLFDMAKFVKDCEKLKRTGSKSSVGNHRRPDIVLHRQTNLFN